MRKIADVARESRIGKKVKMCGDRSRRIDLRREWKGKRVPKLDDLGQILIPVTDETLQDRRFTASEKATFVNKYNDKYRGDTTSKRFAITSWSQFLRFLAVSTVKG